MKQVVGYMTDDGVFFENMEDALLLEARVKLEVALETSLFDKSLHQTFIQMIITYPDEVIELAKAYANVKNLQLYPIKTKASGETDRSGNGGHNTEPDNATMSDQTILDNKD